ncbi:hypothetical protein Mal15_19010 [Stieleria maiorica]|uniref:Uncharacterized protein n=2 Tax=Stieleria maiorica TaxID=2795974 RepID=A0A5B9MEC4_9BACT|nr:hypothetical protein Mal15_19010 [Stieleria maiorica]
MLTALIAFPPPEITKRPQAELTVGAPQDGRKRANSNPVKKTVDSTSKTIHQSNIGDYDEERGITLQILAMVFVLIVPALLIALYLIFNPEAFTDDITPKYDFSNWQFGQRPPLAQ